jgi:chaperonin cofactor prefoldin
MHLSRANSVPSKNNMSMTQVESNVERIQTRIDMIRQESRTLSFRIERMTEQRKNLTQEKNALKDLLTELDVSTTK